VPFPDGRGAFGRTVHDALDGPEGGALLSGREGDAEAEEGLHELAGGLGGLAEGGGELASEHVRPAAGVARGGGAALRAAVFRRLPLAAPLDLLQHIDRAHGFAPFFAYTLRRSASGSPIGGSFVKITPAGSKPTSSPA